MTLISQSDIEMHQKVNVNYFLPTVMYSNWSALLQQIQNHVFFHSFFSFCWIFAYNRCCCYSPICIYYYNCSVSHRKNSKGNKIISYIKYFFFLQKRLSVQMNPLFFFNVPRLLSRFASTERERDRKKAIPSSVIVKYPWNMLKCTSFFGIYFKSKTNDFEWLTEQHTAGS